jgi:hypothetical protein
MDEMTDDELFQVVMGANAKNECENGDNSEDT